MQGDRNEKQKDAQGSAEFENSYRVRQLGYRVWRVGCGPVKKILATQLHTSQSMILWSTIQQILYQEILLQTNSKNLYLNIRNTMLLYFFLGESRYFTNIDHEANPISVTPKKNETLSSKKIRAHAPMQNL